MSSRERVLQYCWAQNIHFAENLLLVPQPWNVLVDLLARPKTLNPALPVDEAKKRVPYWTPAHFRNGRRCTEAVEGADIVALDFDDPAPASLSVLANYVRDELAGSAFFAHSTAKAKPGSVRARGVFPLDRTVKRDEWQSIWRFLNDLFTSDLRCASDRSCGKPEQPLFWPTRSAEGFFECVSIAGDPIPVDDVLAAVRRRQSKEAARVQHVASPKVFSKTPMHVRASTWLKNTPGAVSGQRGHDHTFYVACRLVHYFGLDRSSAVDFMTSWNSTCTPPWSAREIHHKVNQALKKGAPNAGAA